LSWCTRRLAADYDFQLALGSSPASLALTLELRDAVPEMIVLAEEREQITHMRRSLPGLDAISLEDH
jgi:hypothetical protein